MITTKIEIISCTIQIFGKIFLAFPFLQVSPSFSLSLNVLGMVVYFSFVKSSCLFPCVTLGGKKTVCQEQLSISVLYLGEIYITQNRILFVNGSTQV